MITLSEIKHNTITPFSHSMEIIHVTIMEDEMKGFDDLFQVHGCSLYSVKIMNIQTVHVTYQLPSTT